MPRPKTAVTLAIEKIAAKTSLKPQYLRELHREQGMPLGLRAAVAWLDDRPTPGDGTDNSAADLRRERILLTKTMVAKAQLQLEIERGKYISRDEVHRNFASAGQAVRALLLALERGIPAAVCGKGQTEMQGIVRGQLVVVMTKFRDGSEEFWKQHPQSE